ncbi:hypothetical protein VNO77_14303 [Canavalia gladiata]|uniref:Uncharacterized protein n=1 Tax=Canavalia gladiata TaxID=3824 RepID=A0AAN9M1R4_CANGL
MGHISTDMLLPSIQRGTCVSGCIEIESPNLEPWGTLGSVTAETRTCTLRFTGAVSHWHIAVVMTTSDGLTRFLFCRLG